ncbi:hypothetical protein [Nocardioides astragali]|uniref:MFS transporter n=1 Tax=Nocardioides astragali TaxID=1776736 RepID=A0ABW2MY35_9ACTN|nr:hypothetical protein [Nocardioides astragali]
MESIVLRLVLPPLTVLVAGWLQRRVGPRLSGRLVGLPLTSGPLVLVLLLAEGAPTAVTAAQGVLAGQLMVVGFTTAYALGSRTASRARSVLVAALVIVVLLGAVAHLVIGRMPWACGLLVVPLALMALRLWSPARVQSEISPGGPSVPQLLTRAGVTGVLVATLSTSSRLIGAGLSGVLASVPLVIAVVSPATHRDAGADVARAMLRGTLTVVPGTATFAAVLAVALTPLGSLAAFAGAGAAMLLVNRVVGAWDARCRRP